MNIDWLDYVAKLDKILRDLSIINLSGKELSQTEAMVQWRDLAIKLKNSGNRIYFVGNGASASMASHFAADIPKNAGIKTQVFTDLALITALSNDICYKEVYAEPLRWYMKKEDMLIAISSSGNSPNIINAAVEAKQRGGVVVTLSAMDKNNPLRQLGDLNYYAPAHTYGLSETAHAAILHYWMDLVEAKVKDFDLIK